MVDIHTHILPNVDDGAQSWEVAIHMCHMAAQDGVAHMVATPHVNDEYFYDRAQLENFYFSYENLSLLEANPQMFTIGKSQSPGGSAAAMPRCSGAPPPACRTRKLT